MNRFRNRRFFYCNLKNQNIYLFSCVLDLKMNFSDFEQYFYREPVVQSITTGGHFQLLDITDEEKIRAEEYIHVR